jgi:hypothetical protein
MCGRDRSPRRIASNLPLHRAGPPPTTLTAPSREGDPDKVGNLRPAPGLYPSLRALAQGMHPRRALLRSPMILKRDFLTVLRLGYRLTSIRLSGKPRRHSRWQAPLGLQGIPVKGKAMGEGAKKALQKSAVLSKRDLLTCSCSRAQRYRGSSRRGEELRHETGLEISRMILACLNATLRRICSSAAACWSAWGSSDLLPGAPLGP